MQAEQQPTVPFADVNDPAKRRPDAFTVRPDGFIPPEPPAVHPPVDNTGAPAQVLADHTESMDDAMDAIGTQGLGGFVRPYEFENQPVRRPRPGNT